MDYQKENLNLTEKLLDQTNRKVAHAAKIAFVKNKLNRISSHFSAKCPEAAYEDFFELIYDTFIEENIAVKRATLCSYLNILVWTLCQNIIYPHTLYILQTKKVNLLFTLNSHSEINEWCETIIPELYAGYLKCLDGNAYEFSERIMMYIHNNYKKPIDLQDISNSIYVSTSYMCRRFKKEAGMTILEYLTKFRLMVASELLTSTNMKINKIGIAVGYQNNETFVKTFKKNLGLTCVQYRKSKQSG